jgi:hypothetical protein
MALRRPVTHADLVRGVGGDAEYAAPVLARLLVIRSVIPLRDGWSFMPVAEYFTGRGSDAGIAVPTRAGRALARDLALDDALDPGRDLTDVLAALRRLADAFRSASIAYNAYEAHTDPDIAPGRAKLERLAGDRAAAEAELGECRRALPYDVPVVPVRSPVLSAVLSRTAGRMHGFAVGYSPYRETCSYEAGRWPGWFAAALIRAAGGRRRFWAAQRSWSGSADTVVDDVREGRRALSGAASGDWARRVADTVERLAVPVLTGREPATAHTVAVIRLGALALAGEADAHSHHLGDTFRRVAAGVTRT